jgi:hypothetical protein
MLDVRDVLREVQEAGGMQGVEEKMKCKSCGKEIVFLRTDNGKATSPWEG